MLRAATLHAHTTKGGSTMYRKHVANFLLASSLAFGIAPLAAQAQPMPGGMGRGGHPMMQLRALNLSEAQQDQVFKIFHEQAPAMREQMKQVRRSRTELRQLAAAERFDEGRARQIADTQAKAIATLAVMRAQTTHRVREILTPEQRTRMDQMRERRGAGPRRRGGDPHACDARRLRAAQRRATRASHPPADPV